MTTHVIGCDLNRDVNDGTGSVVGDDGSGGERPPGLVPQRALVGVATQAAAPAIAVPLVLKYAGNALCVKDLCNELQTTEGFDSLATRRCSSTPAFSSTHPSLDPPLDLPQV